MREVAASAPYFAVTAEGVLVHLHNRRKGSDGQIAEELDMLQRIYIPEGAKELQADLMDAVHEEAGHPRPLRTYQLLMQRVYWKGVYISVHNRLRNCTKCQFHACRPANYKAPLTGHQLASRCGEKLALDIVHLPKTAEGQEYALTGIDVYSRYGFLVPLKSIKAEVVLRALRERVLPMGMGKSEVWLVDGGSDFKAEFKEVIEARHVHAPLRKEAAGIIEAFNMTIEERMGMLCEDTSRWTDCYPEALDAYNGVPQTACSDGVQGSRQQKCIWAED